ncbi:MAG: VWA domain-containing protein [Firmicutes bacterium]|nr:VWA domain-containing protein [Bacillota bacterium]
MSIEKKLEKRFEEYRTSAVRNVNKPRLPIIMVLDKSGSMADHGGIPMQNLLKSVNRFKQDVCMDPKAAECIDIAILAFDEEVYLVQDWCCIEDMTPVNITAEGGTDIAKGMNAAINMLRHKTREYDQAGIQSLVPHVILVTDGEDDGVDHVAKLIKKRESEGKMRMFTLAAPNYDKETIATLTQGERVLELTDPSGYDFSEFFDFMAISVKAVSTSAPGERVRINHNIGRPGSSCRVPNLDKWLNA